MDAPQLHCNLCCSMIRIERDPTRKRFTLAGVGLSPTYKPSEDFLEEFAYTTDAELAKAADYHLCQKCLSRMVNLLMNSGKSIVQIADSQAAEKVVA